MNVHAKSRLTPEPLRTLRSETKGQAGPARSGRGPSPAPCRQSPRRAGQTGQGNRSSLNRSERLRSELLMR